MYKNGLTKYNTEDWYRLTDEITRQESAKFFVEFATKIFDKKEITWTNCEFSDINQVDSTLKDYVIKSCKLWIFKWYNWKFLPNSKLTSAQSIVVVSRIIWWMMDENVNPWYSNYEDKICFTYGTCPGNSWDFDMYNTVRWVLALFLYDAKDIKNSVLFTGDTRYWKNDINVLFNTAWWWHNIVSWADVTTFQPIYWNEQYDAQDKNHKYNFWEIVK